MKDVVYDVPSILARPQFKESLKAATALARKGEPSSLKLIVQNLAKVKSTYWEREPLPNEAGVQLISPHLREELGVLASILAAGVKEEWVYDAYLEKAGGCLQYLRNETAAIFEVMRAYLVGTPSDAGLTQMLVLFSDIDHSVYSERSASIDDSLMLKLLAEARKRGTKLKSDGKFISYLHHLQIKTLELAPEHQDLQDLKDTVWVLCSLAPSQFVPPRYDRGILRNYAQTYESRDYFTLASYLYEFADAVPSPLSGGAEAKTAHLKAGRLGLARQVLLSDAERCKNGNDIHTENMWKRHVEAAELYLAEGEKQKAAALIAPILDKLKNDKKLGYELGINGSAFLLKYFLKNPEDTSIDGVSAGVELLLLGGYPHPDPDKRYLVYAWMMKEDFNLAAKDFYAIPDLQALRPGSRSWSALITKAFADEKHNHRRLKEYADWLQKGGSAKRSLHEEWTDRYHAASMYAAIGRHSLALKILAGLLKQAETAQEPDLVLAAKVALCSVSWTMSQDEEFEEQSEHHRLLWNELQKLGPKRFKSISFEKLRSANALLELEVLVNMTDLYDKRYTERGPIADKLANRAFLSRWLERLISHQDASVRKSGDTQIVTLRGVFTIAELRDPRWFSDR